MPNKPYILITGVNSDLGFATAKVLAEKHSLILSGRNLDELKEIQSKIKNKQDHLIWNIDLVENKINLKLIKFLDETNAEIKAFVHFAGFFKINPLRLVKEEEIINSFKINVLSAIQITIVLSKKKYRKNLKDIIFISSISALRGKTGFSLYASAKSALSGLTKNLAIELSPVNVNQLILGAINTKKTKSLLDPIKEELDNHIPLKLGNVNQISKWINFMVNNNDKWMTGQEIIIDGGASVL